MRRFARSEKFSRQRHVTQGGREPHARQPTAGQRLRLPRLQLAAGTARVLAQGRNDQSFFGLHQLSVIGAFPCCDRRWTEAGQVAQRQVGGLRVGDDAHVDLFEPARARALVVGIALEHRALLLVERDHLVLTRTHRLVAELGTALLDGFGRPLAISVPVPAQRFEDVREDVAKRLRDFREKIKTVVRK